MTSYLRLALACGLIACSSAASAATLGPFDDNPVVLNPGPTPVGLWIQTTWSGGGYHGNDLVHIGPSDITIYLQTALVITLPVNPALDETAELTTIYGKRSPTGDRTGFDPGSNEFQALSTEIHYGIGYGAGPVAFESFAQDSVVASALQAWLPGVNLSGFDTSSQQVYEVFRTRLPLSQLSAVPEPGTLAMWLAAVVVVGRTWVRRRAP